MAAPPLSISSFKSFATQARLSSKLSAALLGAAVSNLASNPVMGNPPTVVVSASSNAALTVLYTIGTSLQNADKVYTVGGTQAAFDNTNGGLIALSCTNILGTGGNVNSGRYQNACAHHIATDSPNVQFRIYPALGTKFRIAVSEDGGPWAYTTAAPIAFSAGTSVSNYVQLTFQTTVERKIRIEFGINGPGTPTLRSIAVLPSYIIHNPGPFATVKSAWLGDSYSANGAASFSHLVPAILASNKLGWEAQLIAIAGIGYVNTGPNGDGCIQDLLPALSGSQFDVVVFAVGTNDTAYTSTLRAKALSTFKAARALQPYAKFIILGAWPQPGHDAPTSLSLDTLIGGAVSDFNDPNTVWIPLYSDPSGNWMPGTTNTSNANGTDVSGRLISPDNVHANDPGCSYYGNRIEDAIAPYVSVIT